MHAVLSVLGLEGLLKANVGEGPDIAADLEYDVPAPAAVSARRTAHGDKFLASKSDASVSTLSG